MDEGPEIIIGLVGAIGTDLDTVCDMLVESLKDVNYNTEIIRLSSLLSEIKVSKSDKNNIPSHVPWKKDLVDTPEDKRIETRMDAGDELRKKVKRGDALALLSIGAIKNFREKINNDQQKPVPRQAYILRSLKHPDEVESLRNIYGRSFILISAYTPRDKRKSELSRKIAESNHEFQTDPFQSIAEELIVRDEADVKNPYGQNVRSTFPLADVFLDTGDFDKLKNSINRFIELYFYYPFHTPTRDEFAMFHAKGAAIRSSSLSRQVGAVISTPEGDIIAVGTNEVPKAGGGLYWCGDSPDHRDFKIGYDISDRMKRNLLGEILDRFKKEGWLSKEKKDKDINKLVEEAIVEGESPLMRGAQLMNIIEFGRTVHAEMAALVNASYRGVSVKDCYLYTTTFPCHQCARHIVASGIKKVIYIEPYPKSLVPELYLDSISLDDTEKKDFVSFQPFVGVSPRLYMDLFLSKEKRKEKDGKIVLPEKTKAKPRILEWYFPNLAKESFLFVDFINKMRENKLEV